MSVHDLVAPFVEQALEAGPLPAVDTQEFLDAPRHVQLAVLLVAGEAWVYENPRAERARAWVEASHAIAGAPELRRWLTDTGPGARVPFEKLQQQRAVELGPDGRRRSADRQRPATPGSAGGAAVGAA